MALHNDLGKTGEQLAAEYLEDLGFIIVTRNWRHYRHEIDLVTIKDEVLHFIEVKTRRSARFGYPEEAVDGKKIRSFIKAGEAFLLRYPQWKRVQFDVLAISILDGAVEFFLIEDVYV